MKIQAYQFIKYNNDTTIEFIKRVYNTGAIACFDFEDGIVNPFREDLSVLLKEEAREQFNKIYSLIQHSENSIKIGVRLNRFQSSDFEKDLEILKSKSFEAVFLPKTELLKDIELVAKELDLNQTLYKDLIPIIETRKGFENLEQLLQLDVKINKIAFGHCDYNLDIGTYPFFHQDSWEYWKWIAVLLAKVEKYKVRIINSPYLSINNEMFFCSMLDYIATKENHFCGQVTLSTRQSDLCNSRNKALIDFKQCLENKHTTSVDKELAVDLINEFETNNKFKGLSKSRERLLSLQEYIASKNLINDNRIVNELCFIGGCFPVQHNITFENIFHQKLKHKIEDKYQNRLNISIIRYERFSNLINKIETMEKQKSLDLIIFHIRPEPYLRLIKLIYKYINNEGQKKWSLNLPYFGVLKSEKYDMLNLGRMFHSNVNHRTSLFHKFLISSNYLLGKLFGNQRYALKYFYQLTDEITTFCKINKINLIILGPNRRNNNCLEPKLCKELDLYITDRSDKQHYISGYLENKMNYENGIHVTQSYHDWIADRLFETVVNEKLLCYGRMIV